MILLRGLDPQPITLEYPTLIARLLMADPAQVKRDLAESLVRARNEATTKRNDMKDEMIRVALYTAQQATLRALESGLDPLAVRAAAVTAVESMLAAWSALTAAGVVADPVAA